MASAKYAIMQMWLGAVVDLFFFLLLVHPQLLWVGGELVKNVAFAAHRDRRNSGFVRTAFDDVVYAN